MQRQQTNNQQSTIDCEQFFMHFYPLKFYEEKRTELNETTWTEKEVRPKLAPQSINFERKLFRISSLEKQQ